MEELKKEILEEAKAKGLDLAEDSIKAVVEFALAALEKVALKSENKIDDLVVSLLPILKPKLMELIDLIDGEKDA